MLIIRKVVFVLLALRRQPTPTRPPESETVSDELRMRPINELFIQIGPFTHFDNLLNEVFPSCGISVFIAVQQNVQKLKLTLKA